MENKVSQLTQPRLSYCIDQEDALNEIHHASDYLAKRFFKETTEDGYKFKAKGDEVFSDVQKTFEELLQEHFLKNKD